ncbi:hypothetical protein [Peribacillus frigoritolerans]|uniref:hypothetical protein n=1 Tax=Peribacillus frigoritolerans TaxID=450367 RepID=UPI001070D6BF|nr:hypothetical protein [Peribacillus frigoritolerans]TFH62596.1 hypothetical protein E4J71_01980 [Peribacillus frigoritolerans]
MLSKVQNYRLQNGKKLGVYLESKYSGYDSNWIAKDNIIEFIAHVRPLKKPTIYQWEIEEDNIYAINGGSDGITPELSKGRQELERRKATVQVELLGIYNFIKQYHLEEDQPIELVMEKANEQFGLPINEIEAIYLKVDNILYGKPLV